MSQSAIELAGGRLRADSEAAKELIVVTGADSGASDDRLVALAEWMGVPTRKIVAEGDCGTVIQALEREANGDSCVALSAEVLGRIAKTSGPAVVREFIGKQVAKLLVFCREGSERTCEALTGMSGGEVRGIRPGSTGQAFHFPEGGKKYSRQFAGLGFPGQANVSVPTLDTPSQTSRKTQVILAAGGLPVLVRMECGSCELFVLALEELPDIQTPLSQDRRIEEFYDRLVPLLIFLRHGFGEQCWHAPANTARLIIDDPILGSRYGFLDYSALLQSMRDNSYGTSVAFIPWNHWRTTRTQAARFLEQRPAFSICVHGCDHTNKEFGIVDDARLHWKADTALRRMERHQKRSGMPFDSIMVFPQGWFSTPALKALRASNYLGAINTTCFPTNEHSEQLTMADFLRPAVTRFHGLPLFQRRYPKRLVDFAFDIFLGKPAFIVEHHQYFEEGLGKLERFVEDLHKVEPTLSWPTLSDQLMRCCAMRTVSESKTEVQFFTRQFVFSNDSLGRKTVMLTRHEPEPSLVSKVLVDGASVPFSFRGEYLVLEAEADHGQTLKVEVVDAPASRTLSHRPGVKETVGVPVRRVLSEFRDNTLARHPRLLAAATGLARRMKATADHDREDPG